MWAEPLEATRVRGVGNAPSFTEATDVTVSVTSLSFLTPNLRSVPNSSQMYMQEKRHKPTTYFSGFLEPQRVPKPRFLGQHRNSYDRSTPAIFQHRQRRVNKAKPIWRRLSILGSAGTAYWKHATNKRYIFHVKNLLLENGLRLCSMLRWRWCQSREGNGRHLR